MMRRTYLKEKSPAIYSLYMREDRLTEHLNAVDDEAQKRMDILVCQRMGQLLENMSFGYFYAYQDRLYGK